MSTWHCKVPCVSIQITGAQVLAASGEQLKEAWHEIEVMRRVSHPNIMPLLRHATLPAQGEGGAQQCIYMLMPLFEVSFSLPHQSVEPCLLLAPCRPIIHLIYMHWAGSYLCFRFRHGSSEH